MKQFAPELMADHRLLSGPALVICFLLFFLPGALGQNLPLQKFTTADGLAQDNVNRIVRDSRGFLWFCTGDGLSRFDGHRFKNYTQEQGLPHRNVTDLLETKAGEYLVATSGGISILDRYGMAVRWDVVAGRLETASAAPLFRTFVPRESADVRWWTAINSLAEHSNGIIYAAANHGLFGFVGEGDNRRYEKVEYEGWRRDQVINTILEDSRGSLWIVAPVGIYRMDRTGAIETVADIGGNSIFEDREGLIWIDSGGHDLGIRVYRSDGGRPILVNTFTKNDGIGQNSFSNVIAQTPAGQIYASSEGVLYEFRPDALSGTRKFVEVARGHISNSAVDSGGNLWFGTFSNGALKLPTSNIASFHRDEKKSPLVVGSMYFDRSGGIYLTTIEPKIEHLVNSQLQTISPLGLERRLWGETFLDLQSSNGEWWIPTEKGLFRYPAVKDAAELANTPPKKIYDAAEGLSGSSVFNLFEDSRGDLWMMAGNRNSPYRWDRASDTIAEVGNLTGITPNNGGVNSWGEDRSGNMWLAFYFGGLGRIKNGEFRKFDAADGIPEGYVSDFLSDREGRLWIATRSRGIFRVDEPNADTPVFANVSTRDGLHSNQANCLAEDGFGRIYVGTGRGLHRIDPQNESVKVYTEGDGLPGSYVYRCRTDAGGNIWFVTSNALVRLTPSPENATAVPTTYVDGFLVNGTARRISELGETELAGIDLDAGQNRIEISYFALGTGTGETPRYQYRIGDQEWSAPSTTSSVSFDLAPGTYSFGVRSVLADGTAGDAAAAVSFSIARPVWQRGWFLLLAFLVVGGSIFALDRYRVSKTRQVKQALLKSVESEKRLRTLADTASDAIITIDEDSTIVFVNQSVERVFGYTPEELVGTNLTMLMPERMRGGHGTGLSRYVSSSTKNIEWSGVMLPGLHKDGREIPLELSFGEFERDGKRYFTGIARDVTERLRAEEEIRKGREERMRELQKVRSRIATDLHDDIGSSLTQIAVLSEVARGQASHLHADGVATPLERIKSVSKELVAVMSDIVWAINPQKDYLNDLVQRMRRFGSDVLSGRGIHFEFNTPETDDSIELGANIRREVFAIFKESINNAAKYSACKTVVTHFTVSDDWLMLQIRDDGKGFDTDFVLSKEFRPDMGGNGLASIRRRTNELGGFCDISSAIGTGTVIDVKIPLGRRDEGMKDEG